MNGFGDRVACSVSGRPCAALRASPSAGVQASWFVVEAPTLTITKGMGASARSFLAPAGADATRGPQLDSEAQAVGCELVTVKA